MPQLATLLCILGIGYLFWVDRKDNEGVSNAILIPLIWMFFAGSKFPSQWLGAPPPDLSAGEGSPIDRNVFLILIVAAVWVLSRRRVEWRRVVASNPAVWLFFLYCLISAGWADDSLLSLKRFIKGIGNLMVALVILTERNQEEALAFCVRRISFILMPLSVLYVKFYPELGRAYWMGEPLYCGATYGKNALGQLCLIVGIYFAWEVLLRRSSGCAGGKKVKLSVLIAIGPITAWLLYIANSATSLACMVMAIGLLLLMRTEIIVSRPTRIFYIAISAIVAFTVLDAGFDLKGSIIHMLGRRPDLTDRDFIWELVVSMQQSPWIGYGYESFWTGERLARIWQQLDGIIQAHNGYIDVYLNLGFVGLSVLLASIVKGLANLNIELKENNRFAALKMTFIVVILIYNYTEATFVPVSNTFTILLICILQVRQPAENVKGRAPPMVNLVRRKPRDLRLRSNGPTRLHREPETPSSRYPGSVDSLVRRAGASYASTPTSASC